MSPYLIYYFQYLITEYLCPALYNYKTGTYLQHVDEIHIVSLQHFFDELD